MTDSIQRKEGLSPTEVADIRDDIKCGYFGRGSIASPTTLEMTVIGGKTGRKYYVELTVKTRLELGMLDTQPRDGDQ